MSTFFYNGITISPIYTEACSRRAIYDGPTYLYTRWIIRVRGVFNPGATSFTTAGGDPRFGGNPAQPEKSPGFNPAWTDNSVRLMLQQPRGLLHYSAAGPDAFGDADFGQGQDLTILALTDSTISTSGSSKTLTDANNGPFPLEINIRRISGTVSFNVDFTIQCDINECYRVYSEPAFVLSNRWQMTHDVNEHAFTVRHVQGRAIFRTDVMLSQEIKPDDYRAAFFFPVPENFKRQNINVSVNPDGNECHYSFSDVEQSHNIICKKNVTKIEAWANISVSQGSLEQGVVALAKAAKRAAMHPLREAARSTTVAPGAAAGAAMAGIELASSAAAIEYGLLPRATIAVNVRVWGNRLSTRKDLEQVSAKVIALKLPQLQKGIVFNIPLPGINIPIALVGLGRLVYGTDANNNYDLMGRYVDASITLHCGPISSFFNAPAALIVGLSKRFPELLDDNIGDIATTKDTKGYAMPNDSGSRGTYTEFCVAQALQNICGNPPGAVLVARPKPEGSNLLKVPPGSQTATSLPTTPSGTAPLDSPDGQTTLRSGGRGGSTISSR